MICGEDFRLLLTTVLSQFETYYHNVFRSHTESNSKCIYDITAVQFKA
jgi:hypothetical protein